MSKTTKKNATAKKSVATKLTEKIVEVLSKNEAETPETIAVNPRTRFYTVSASEIPTLDTTKSRQRKLVLGALHMLVDSGAIERGTPVKANDLADQIAGLQAISNDYKVKNGDVAGSIGFHLRMLASEGVLRGFYMRQIEGGWEEVAGKTEDASN